MANEVRVAAEGTLKFIQASGSGRTWATASAAPSGLVAYVQSFSFTSGQTTVQVMERGVPDHHKIVSKQPIDVTFECLWTGSFANALTASGTTVPMFHLEHKAAAQEIGATSAFYHQFHGAVLQSVGLTEAAEGNRISLTFRALAMNGATASGYLG